MAEKIKVQIDRAHWRKGGKDYDNLYGETLLKNSKGYMCCLGFIGEALGQDLSDGSATPYHTITSRDRRGALTEGKEHWPELTESNEYGITDTSLAGEAMELNDVKGIENEVREARILEVFEDSIYEIEFVGEYPERERDS